MNPELLAYVGRIVDAVVSAAQALCGGHAIGFPDIRGVFTSSLSRSTESHLLEEMISDDGLRAEIRRFWDLADKLHSVDAQIVTWLSKRLDPSGEGISSKRKLLQIVDESAAAGVGTSDFPPRWTREAEYKRLLGVSSECLEELEKSRAGIRAHMGRLARKA